MKSIIILFASAFLFIFTSCGSSTKNTNTHTHENGSVHTDHSPDEQKAMPAQESFKAEADSLASKAQPEAKHDHGHDHSAETGHKH